MNNSLLKDNIKIWLGVFAIIFFFCYFFIDTDPKCIRSGCDNKCASGSSYCYLHKPYRHSYSSSKRSSSSKGSSGSDGYSGSKSSSSSSSTSYGSASKYNSSTSKKNSSTKKKSYQSYDDGYDDIYMNDDYDDYRYQYDSDYADGVDDAMDEFEEDW